MKTILNRISRLECYACMVRPEGYVIRANRAEKLASQLAQTLVMRYSVRALIDAGVLNVD